MEVHTFISKITFELLSVLADAWALLLTNFCGFCHLYVTGVCKLGMRAEYAVIEYNFWAAVIALTIVNSCKYLVAFLGIQIASSLFRSSFMDSGVSLPRRPLVLPAVHTLSPAAVYFVHQNED